jgi:hypothetical protein
MKKIIVLIVAFLVTNAHGQIVVFSEDFSSGSLPFGWTQDSAGYTPVLNWKFNGAPLNVTGAGFDSNYPRINSTLYPSDYVACSLISSSFSSGTISSAYLSYSEHFYDAASPSNPTKRKIEISLNNGITWQDVFESNLSHGNPVAIKNIINITAYAIGQINIKIKFYYQGHSGGWWAIDNVQVSDSVACLSPPDNGTTKSTTPFSCTGSPANLYIENLSRGIGQTYQWQLKNAANGNVWTNVSGSISDTLNTTQNGPTYYRCSITCSGLSTNSQQLNLSDVPSAIDAYSDGIHICAGRDDTLRLYQPYGGIGVGWQWQQRFSAVGTYTDIPGATSDTYVVGVSNLNNKPFFKCKQICLSNGTNNTGFWANEAPNPNPLCYCYPFTNNPCSNMDYISAVSITGTTLNHTAVCEDTLIVHLNNNNYQFFDPALGNTTATLHAGSTYTINISVDSISYFLALWIDFNRNGTFDSTEYIKAGLATKTTPSQTQFTIPANAVAGITGMRLRSQMYWWLDSTWACVGLVGGTTYDYLVTIDTTTGIMNIEQGLMNVEVFPNPAKDEITVMSKESGVRSVEIENVVGEKVFSLRTPNSKLPTKIDVSGLAPGIYFVKVTTDKGSVVRKFIKQ